MKKSEIIKILASLVLFIITLIILIRSAITGTMTEIPFIVIIILSALQVRLTINAFLKR